MDESRPFDAVESYLCDSNQGVGARHTVSLVVALRGILQYGPQFEQPSPQARREAFHTAADELTRRGIDAASLVRYGMTREVMGVLLAALLFGLVPELDIPAPEHLADGLDLAAWCRALGLPERPRGKSPSSLSDALAFGGKVIGPAIPLLENWVLTARLDDLLLLTPPTDVELLRNYHDPLVDELNDQYQWAVDHFTETFYHDWRTSSLHHAYRWLSQAEAPPCAPELMRDRKIDVNGLNAEIARRVASDKDPEPRSLPPAALLAPEMVRFARPLLHQQRYREAAAVFEFGAGQLPGNGELRNNLGFCLIPEAPSEALEHLEAADRLGYPRCDVNTYNQMCCYASMSKARAALNRADSMWNSITPRSGGSAVLWQRGEDGSWNLFDSEDPRGDVAEYAAKLASAEGWKKEEKLWQDRVCGLDGVAD